MEEFEFKGLWWFPQFPNHQVAGTLRFHPVDGAVLETMGDNFTGPITELFGVRDEPFTGATLIPQNIVIDTICGYTNKGDAVTLWKCVQGGENWAIGYVGSTIRAQAVFIGCHFEKGEDIVFDSMAINYSHLESWLGITGFSGGFRRSETGEYLGGEIKYELPDRVEFRVNNLNIAFYHKLGLASDLFVDIHTKQTTFVEITPDNPMHYNDYYSDIIYHLRNFLSLGTGTAVLPLVVKARNKNCTLENSKGESIPRDVYIFYTAKGSTIGERKQIDRWDMLFRYQDIVDEFQTCLQNWFMRAEKLRPVFDLYFGIFYIPSMYVHLEFLTLAQALETYHRRMYDGMFMPLDQYETIRQTLNQAIPKTLDDDHRNSLKSRIQFGYEYSLRKRLKHLLTDVLAPYRPTVDRLVGRHSEFINDLVNTRNYLTHYTEELDKVAVTDPQGQYNFVQKMRLLMQLCLFIELGLPAETVEKLVLDNRRFKHWSR